MLRSLLAIAVVAACAVCPLASARVFEQPGGAVQVESSVPPGRSLAGPRTLKAGSPDAVYSNLGAFRNQSFAAGGATQQLLNTITRLAADDLNLVGAPPFSVNGFRFVVTNLDTVDIAASPLVRFWLPDGPGGGPGTLVAAFTYNPIVFTAGRVGTIKTSTKFVLESAHVWAGIAFDNNGGTTGATAPQLDNLAQGIFSPADLGTSTDQYFVTTAAGSFATDNPVGTIGNFNGSPPADFGWEILTAQDVDLSVAVSDGVGTVFPGGSVTYTITASNAGPDTVFDARVVDTFPATLTCSWTCAGTAGNTCAASGAGSINDATVALAPGGSVTYTASCTLSPAASGTLVNTASILAPGTAVEANIADNTATDSDAITPMTIPGPPAGAIARAGNAQATVAFSAPASDGGSAVTSYTATSSPAGISASGPVSPLLVSGLTNGTAYTFTVTATNAIGTGPPSAPTNSVTPAAVPGAPTIGTATPGNAQATVTFAPPASNGGSAITSYTVTSSPGGNSAGGAGSPITVTGLTNGTAYTFTVTATNAVGTGLPSAPSNSVTPATLPGAPTIGAARAGNAQAAVVFLPPLANGGSAITSFTVTSSPGAISATGPASPILVSGLTNGTAYTFTVTATNGVGTGPPSAASNSVTPAAVPGAPTIGIASPGNAQAKVAFTPPASSGGSPITSYTATSSPGGISASGPASPITVTGLTNGTAYTFTVTASNAVGTGLESAPSNSVTPATVPGAPAIGTATAGNTQAVVAFTPPASTGGSRITSYTATSSPGAISASATASPITVPGLTNGTAYTFTVVATNALGDGPPSAASNSVTPGAVPGAPTIVAANPGNGRATVAFTPPASNGGLPITSFTATCGASAASGASSPLVVTGLANGTPASCSVTATNAAGTGPASAPASVTPDAVVRSFTAPSATGSGTITAIFTGGGLTCSFATSAFIPLSGDPASPPAGSITAIAFPHGLFAFSLDGCTPGSTVTFTIAYPAALPAGTNYWKYGPEPGATAPHWYILPATITGSTVSFSITDGGQGDDDLAANGTFVDQGGPGAPPAGAGATAPAEIPTLSQWALVLLATLVLGFAAPRLRRVR